MLDMMDGEWFKLVGFQEIKDGLVQEFKDHTHMIEMIEPLQHVYALAVINV